MTGPTGPTGLTGTDGDPLLARIVEASGDAIFSTDRLGVVLYWNRAAEVVYGFSSAEMLGESVARLMSADAAAEWLGHADRVHRGQGSLRLERLHVRKDGEPVEVELMLSPLRGRGDDAEGVVVVARDITARKHSQREQSRYDRMLRALNDCNQAMVRATDELVLLEAICRILVESELYDAAWVACTLDEAGHVPRIVTSWGEASEAIEERAHASATARRPVLSLALTVASRAIGTLNVRARRAEAFDPGERALLDELASDVSFGMGTMHARALHEQTRAELELFRELIDHSNDAIFVNAVPSGSMTDVNDTACRLLGYTREELLSLGMGEIDPTIAGPAGLDRVMQSVRASGGGTAQVRVRHKDGSMVSVESSARVVQVAGKEYLISIVRDLTARHNAEVELEASERRYHSLFDESLDGVFETTLDGRFLNANPQAVAMLGYVSRHELLGASVEPHVVADMSVRAAHLEDVAAGGGAETERLVRRRDGRLIRVHATTTASRDASGSVVGFRSIVRDITEQHQTEERLRQLSSAVEQSPVSIVITDLKGDIEYVNPRFTQVTGYEREEVLGRNPRILKSGSTPVQTYIDMWRAITSGQEWEGEIENRRKNGESYLERIRIAPIVSPAGAITHFVAVKADITEERRLEDEFRRAQKMEAFGQLAGGVAHDFNNILTVIQGNAAMMQGDTSSDPDQAEKLDQIIAASQRAARLTRQLLFFSRRQAVQLAALDLNEVVANVTSMLQRLIGEHIVLEARYAPGRAPVKADVGMIEQVLVNLVVNARDAMPGGGRLLIESAPAHVDALMAARHPDSHEGDFVRLRVRDSGTGIRPEILPHIFEPYFTTKEIGRGTGLGLATVFGIIHQHGGWIAVESEVGKGTTFDLYLPVHAGSAPKPDARTQDASKYRGSATVLVVEDEPALRRLATMILEQHGYRVLQAASGAIALELWKVHAPEIDLLFTDMVMPDGVDGWALGQRLLGEKPGLEVLYTTGYSDEMLGEGAVLRGAFNLIEKPYDPVSLLKKVHGCLRPPRRRKTDSH